jgi:glycosyltransferase involved in cell wall biosynthesis
VPASGDDLGRRVRTSAEVGRGRVPVSVVIPCFCCSATIGRAMDSVAVQTAVPFEIILVDDASPDGGETLNALYLMAARYGDVFDVKIIALKENGGAGSARNRGWELASQPYIAFLDADDAWHPQKIEYQLDWMTRHPAYGLVGHAHMRCDACHPAWPVLEPGNLVLPIARINAMLSNPFATPTVMLKRDLPFRFKDGKRYAEDYLLWLQIICSDVPAARGNLPLAATFKEDFGEGGLSANLWPMEKGELDAYRQILRDGKIGRAQFLLLSIFSVVKFFRRFVLACRFGRR